MLKKIAKTLTTVAIAVGVSPLTAAFAFWAITPSAIAQAVTQAKLAQTTGTTSIPINTVRLSDTLDASVRLGYLEQKTRAFPTHTAG